MWISTVHVQLPDPLNILLLGASRRRHTNFPGVRRKNGIAPQFMVGVPDFLYVLSVDVTHIDRFLFTERDQRPIGGITSATRRDVSQTLRRTSQHGHGPYCSPICFVVQIVPQQQKLGAVRRNIQDTHGADRGAERRRGSSLYRHFDVILSADEINARSVGQDRGTLGFVRKGELLHRQWRSIGGRAPAGKSNPRSGAHHGGGPNPDPLPRLLLRSRLPL